MIQATSLKTHHITLFYFFNHSCPLAELKEAELPFTFQNDQAETTLWQRHKYNLSKDFIPSIHQLFHRQPATIQSWALNKAIMRRINQQKIQLVLSKAAQKRLKQNHPGHNTKTLTLYLDRVLHHNFATGFGISSVELHLQGTDNAALDTQHINEALHSLTRLNTLHTSDKADNTFSLGQMIRQLHGEAANSSPKTQRVYSHCLIQIADEPENTNCTRLADQLALHYTDDYQIADTHASIQHLQDFQNITHAFAQEGSATIINITPDSPEILKDYYNKVICPVQQPLHLLSEHLHHAMQHYSLISSPLLGSKLSRRKKEQLLHTIHEQLLNFKLRYFQPVISQVNRHNRIQETLYQVKKINEQYPQLGNNIETLNQLIKHTHQSRYCKLASFGIAAAGYLTSFSILKEAIEVIPEWPQLQKIAPQLSETLHHYHLSTSLAGSLLVALIILFFSYRHCKHQEPHSHGTAHKLLEILHARHPLHK